MSLTRPHAAPSRTAAQAAVGDCAAEWQVETGDAREIPSIPETGDAYRAANTQLICSDIQGRLGNCQPQKFDAILSSGCV